jgi:hypothetical protein
MVGRLSLCAVSVTAHPQIANKALANARITESGRLMPFSKSRLTPENKEVVARAKYVG